MPEAGTPSTREERIARAVVVASIAWAVAASLAMARSDFWLDEVWSWNDAQKLKWPWEVFTAIHLDNNHYLTTLWVWMVGRTPNWGWYRLPSLVCGIGSVAMLARLGWRRSPREGAIAAALGGSSYLLAEYSSEARGYTIAIFFSLVCLDLWQSEQFAPHPKRWIAFAGAAILGLLGHLTFLFPYAGILAMDARLLWRDRANWRNHLGRISDFHTAPLAALAVLWWVDIRFMQVGGGPSHTKAETIGELISLVLEVNPTVPLATAAFSGVWGAILLVIGLAALGEKRADERRFFLVSIVLAPAAMLLVTRPTTFYPRYLLTCVPPFLLLVASLVSRGMEHRGALRGIAAATLCWIVPANMGRTVLFFPNGRGGYWEAYRDIQKASDSKEISVGGEYDFRDAYMMQFYEPLLPRYHSGAREDESKADEPTRKLIYSMADNWISRPPDWLIFERLIDQAPPKDVMRLRNGAMYRLVKTYPYSSIVSGFNWYVYQRLTPG